QAWLKSARRRCRRWTIDHRCSPWQGMGLFCGADAVEIFGRAASRIDWRSGAKPRHFFLSNGRDVFASQSILRASGLHTPQPQLADDGSSKVATRALET